MSHSPNKVSIHLPALVHNLNQVKKLIGPKTRIMGIVKSDAYGHGLIPVSRTLERSGIHSLGVAYVHEALELRKNGITIPINILCGIRSRQEAEACLNEGLQPIVFDLGMAEALSQEAERKKGLVKVSLKVDTGMGRLGIHHLEVGHFLKRLMEYKGLYIEGLASHLSSAHEASKNFTNDQIRYFQKAVDTGRSLGLDLPLNHLANSAGIMAYKDSHFNMVRPGIMLYGGLPSPDFNSPVSLKPVMTLKGTVLQIRDLPGSTPVSYDRTYHTKGPQQLAVTSAGYGDGLFRSVTNAGKALIGGERVNMVGAVCMNMIVCDITHVRDIVPGDEVVYLGAQRDEHILGDDIARWADTISYEVFCSIGQKADKEYSQ